MIHAGRPGTSGHDMLLPVAVERSPMRSDPREPRGYALFLTLALLAIAAPVSLNLWLIWQYGVNAPVHDDWWLAYKFTQFDSGLRWSEVIGQANESRPAIPALVLYALAGATGWDVRFQMLAAQALITCTALGLLHFTRSTLGLSWPASIALGALSAALLHSPVQHQSLLWGIQVILYVPAACLVACLLIARLPLPLPARTLLQMAACAVATYSYANGMTLFAIVPWLTVLDARRSSLRQRLILFLAWAAAFGLCIWQYFSGYQSPAAVPGMSTVFDHVADAGKAYLLYLGAPLAIGPRPAVMAALLGAAELVLLVACAVRLLATSSGRDRALRAVPWILLTAYGLLAGVLIVIGRLGFGVEYALAPRYVAFSVFVLIGTIHLVALTAGVAADGTRLVRAGLAAGAGLVAVLHVLAVGAALPRYPALKTERLQSKAATWLIPQLPYPLLVTKVSAFMSDAMALPLAEQVDAKGWLASGLLRDLEGAIAGQSLAPDAGGMEPPVAQPDDAFQLHGWCATASPTAPCNGVLVTARSGSGIERACTAFFPAEPRLDLAKALGMSEAAPIGWTGTAACSDAVEMRVWAIDIERRSLRLIGSVDPR
jgi:hypothetical protein